MCLCYHVSTLVKYNYLKKHGVERISNYTCVLDIFCARWQTLLCFDFLLVCFVLFCNRMRLSLYPPWISARYTSISVFVTFQPSPQGCLTDGKRRTIEWKDAVFIMTSNLASLFCSRMRLNLYSPWISARVHQSVCILLCFDLLLRVVWLMEKGEL